MAEAMDFTLERYKYILSRKSALNEATFKITAIYQAAVAALGAGQFSVLVSLKGGSIERDLAKLASVSLLVLFVVTTALTLSLLIGGIFAWLKYRRDESNVDQEIRGMTRPAITFRNAAAWYETYLIVVILALCAFAVYGSVWHILPRLA